MIYWRPIVMTDPLRPKGAVVLADGWTWFDRVAKMRRGEAATIVPASDLPKDVLDRLTAPRAPVLGMTLDTPRIMGILNVTPDSFSDGGLFDKPQAALEQARAMAAVCDILDVGGESTRPGAAPVATDDEIARTAPVIAAIRAEMDVPMSIDTRKAPVAKAALSVGAGLVNDVSAFTHDRDIAQVTAAADAPCCLMHSIGTPETMQNDPRYDDVVFDVYDHLAERVAAAEAGGIRRDRIIVDPGIGFGKTVDHNLLLLKNLSVFHGLGCAVLLGASRKRFIGTLGDAPHAQDRMPGSIAIALHGLRQGMQILRVHDTLATRQAVSLQMAVI